MRRHLISALLCLLTLSCAGHRGSDDVRFPIVRYNPATYLTDIENAFADASTCGYLSADSKPLADLDKEMIEYLKAQEAFVVQLNDGEASELKFVGMKDKEKGYLKYLNLEKEQFSYSLDQVICDLYGSLDEYIATWPEDQRSLFHDEPQGLYTFPLQHHARIVIGYGNSANPKNPVKYKAAISFLRASRAEWNDDTWANDSTEIVKHAEEITGAFLHFTHQEAQFENAEPNRFSVWVRDRFTYPSEALESGTTGRVTAQFTIDMFGNLEDAKVLRGLHPAIDSAVVSLISSSPKWTPASDIAGNPYSVTYTFPVIITPEMINKARSF